MGVDASTIIATSLWGDGVPMNFDRKQSLEVLSFGLPGLEGIVHNIRFPITVVPKKYVAKGCTKDDLLTVIAWSFQHLGACIMPSARHDGEPWLATDVWRKKTLQKAPRGALLEVKGDWAFMKETFRFPQFNELRGCCWLCSVCPMGFEIQLPQPLGEQVD